VPTQQSEFGDERRRQFAAARIPRIRMFRGDMVAEIIIERRKQPAVVHCVVQRQGSPEILLLQQFYSQEEAKAAAEHFMSAYGSKCRQAKLSG
jgi:hypothetical protein